MITPGLHNFIIQASCRASGDMLSVELLNRYSPGVDDDEEDGEKEEEDNEGMMMMMIIVIIMNMMMTMTLILQGLRLWGLGVPKLPDSIP